MTTLQPRQLSMFFTKSQQKEMEKDLMNYFTGKAKIGIHTVVMESAGKLTDYYVGFICEQPNNPRPFIILVVIASQKEISHHRFVRHCDGIAAKADELPERKAALMRNLQNIRN